MTLDKETLLEAAEICGYERERWQSSREELPDDVSGAQDACDNLARTFTKLAAQQPESSRDAVLEVAAQEVEKRLEYGPGGYLAAARIIRALKNAGGQESSERKEAERQYESCPPVPPAPDAAPQVAATTGEAAVAGLTDNVAIPAEPRQDRSAAAAPSNTADDSISYSPHRIHSTSVAPSAASPNHPYLQECLDAIDKHNASAPKGSDPTIRALIDAILRWQGIMRDDHTLCKAANAALPALQRLAERKQP